MMYTRTIGDDVASPHVPECQPIHNPYLGDLAMTPELTRKARPTVIRSRAVGALALGAIAVGALAIGAVAIGRLAIGRARIRRLEIDELVVRHLSVTGKIKMPPSEGGR